MPETLEPPVAEKSFMDSAEFDTGLQTALDASAKARTDATGEVTPPAVPAPPPAKAADADPKAAAAAADLDALPEDIKSDAGKSSWKRLKESKGVVEKERDTIKTERDTLRAEFEALKKTAATPAEKRALAEEPEFIQLKALAEAKDKELAEYSERLRIVDVEQHPKFRAYFDGKVSAQMAMAEKAGGARATEIFKLPDGDHKTAQLEELAAELSPMKAAQLYSVSARLDEIQAERAGEIASAKANYATIQAEQKQQSEQRIAATQKLFQQVTADVTDREKGLAVFQKREGDEEWNKGVDERLAVAQRAFKGDFTAEEAARAVYWASAAPAFLQQLTGELTKNAALEKEIAALRAVAPNPGGARAAEADTQLPSAKTGLDGMMEVLQPTFQPVR